MQIQYFGATNDSDNHLVSKVELMLTTVSTQQLSVKAEAVGTAAFNGNDSKCSPPVVLE